MQGSNFSRIGMNNQRKGFDDQNWGYGKKETRGSKGKGSKNQQVRNNRNNKNQYRNQEQDF